MESGEIGLIMWPAMLCVKVREFWVKSEPVLIHCMEVKNAHGTTRPKHHRGIGLS